MLLVTTLSALLLSGVAALYEDQAGKFDWRRAGLGAVTRLGYHATPRHALLLVATEENVLAGLDADSGAVVWRHALERGDVGKVWDLAVLGRHTTTVTGGAGELFLRWWDSQTGALVGEQLVRPGRVPDLVSLQPGPKLLLGYYGDNNQLELTTQTIDPKRVGEPDKAVMGVPFQLGGTECRAGAGLLVCADHTSIHWCPGLGGGAVWQSKAVTGIAPASLRLVGVVAEVGAGAGTATLDTNTGQLVMEDGIRARAGCGGVVVHQVCEQEGLDSEGGAYCAEHTPALLITQVEGEEVKHELEAGRGGLESVWAVCETGSWQLLAGLQDGSLISLTPRGNLMFVREEGLASLHMVSMVARAGQESQGPAPVSAPHSLDPNQLLQSFLARLRRHVAQLQGAMLALTDLRLGTGGGKGDGDRFGLRQVLVACSRRGAVYGLDSQDGTILWRQMVPGRALALHTVREGRADSGAARAILVYAHHRSGHFLLTFNPVTGLVVGENAAPAPLEQTLLLPELPALDRTRPLLLVGRDGSAHLHPAAALPYMRHNAAQPKLFVVRQGGGGQLSGNLVQWQSSGPALTPVWSLAAPGSRLVAVRSRQQDEHVHSAGRVMADRSVLFKYMNPNLALVVSEGEDGASKTFMAVQMVDLVTGRVYYSATHKKVLPPFHAVHSENWAVYTFFNEKQRRTELVSLEMYEGKEQSNATLFSSIDNSVVPLVERQAYILPLTPQAITETMTTKGITAKHLLVASTGGAVLDLPLHMVDPRRPALSTPAHLREPGIPPYTPELPLPPESILNYNQHVAGVRGLVSSPSGLESTVLVFVYGLDLYGTRLAPSKGFDLIKDDFEYLMITAVLAGLAAASYGTKKLAQRKMLNQAWK